MHAAPPPMAQLLPAADAVQREINALRSALPKGCEQRQFGDDPNSYNQLTPALRAEALQLKYVSMAGRAGANCARNRRALARYIAFATREGISPHFPVGPAAFSIFTSRAVKESKGAKGGKSVATSLKAAFISLKVHNGLLVSFDAPIIFNVIKPYKGDSESATAPSIWAARSWEVGAASSECPKARLVCQVAVLACILTLRAVHFVGATVLPSSNERDIRINLLSDKDGSRNVWVGCRAQGITGCLLWWPQFMRDAIARGSLVPEVSTSVRDPSLAQCSVEWNTGVTSAGMVHVAHLSFLVVGVSRADQKLYHFTGHSWRHFYPNLAELFAWLSAFRDELGRWATGAANAKRSNCGSRYSKQANRALQLFLRCRCLECAVFLWRTFSDAMNDSALPDFEAFANSDELKQCDLYGPSAIGYIPEWGRQPAG